MRYIPIMEVKVNLGFLEAIIRLFMEIMENSAGNSFVVHGIKIHLENWRFNSSDGEIYRSRTLRQPRDYPGCEINEVNLNGFISSSVKKTADAVKRVLFISPENYKPEITRFIVNEAVPFDSFTPAQKRLYLSLLDIRPGKVISYGSLARNSGINSPRAVGRILASNRFPILIPCHRVISADGSLGGYMGKYSKIKFGEFLKFFKDIPARCAADLTKRNFAKLPDPLKIKLLLLIYEQLTFSSSVSD